MTLGRPYGRFASVVGALAAVLAAAPALAAPDAAPTPANSWTADLGTVDGDDVNVTATPAGLRLADPTHRPAGQRGGPAEGMLLTAAQDLATPANRVFADLAAQTGPGAQAEVSVRGRDADGWTEWRTATGAEPALFDRAVTQVETRIRLSAEATVTPTVRSVRLRADAVAGTTAATAGLVYRVYATREGLVGGTTSNGHVIASRDHFVALPSTRGLSPKGSGSYTVRVCTTTASRCEYAPVWDVGPWNTRDDYWNPSSTREMWKDLPQGRPEAQAAYQSGYNGGRDQFGRAVANPAGIDLADGVFWDGLLLSDNSWVDVAYLWTGTGTRARVGDGPLTLRSGPGTGYTAKGFAAMYAHVPVECYATGTSVSGPYGTTSRWYRLAAGQYVSAAYISGIVSGSAPGTC